MISVIVSASEGGRPLLRTADSVARQQNVRELMLALPGDRKTAIADSIVRRLSATAVRHGAHGQAAINEAVRLSAGEILAIVPAGVELLSQAAEIVSAAFERWPLVGAFGSGLRLHTPDGIGQAEWWPEGTSAEALLTDPRDVSPVMLVTRGVWDAMGGLDETLGDLALYELWLRLALSGDTIGILERPIAARELPEAARADDPAEYLAALARIFERHQPAIRKVMQDVLVAREVRFGQLRERHRRLIDERDRGLAELDAIRAEIAHHRAYLRHHKMDGLDWGDLRRTDPVSRDWGYERGGPVDRRYIEAFVESHSSDVHGAVLEIQEPDFTRLAGGPRVVSSAVLDVDAANPRATVISDLRAAPELASDRFDCVILTQTIHVIDDMAAVAREIHRALRPGGVLLATIPAGSRVCLEYGERGDFWRTTPAGAAALFEPVFADGVEAEGFGNVLTNVAFLHGLGAQELTDAEYDVNDPYYPALTGVRARKGGRGRPIRGVVLMYHRVHDAPDAHGLNVPAALLDAHLAWLARECTMVPLERMLESDPDDLPERAVALTFDDGYEDNLEAGVPVLERHSAPATFFLTTRWLDEPGEYWWDALERILLGEPEVPPALDLTLNGEFLRLPTGGKVERRAAHWRLHPMLVHARAAERDRIMAAIEAWGGGASAPQYRPMQAQAIRELARHPGVSIGAHGVDHVALPDQPLDVRLREIADSRSRLASIVDRPISLFAYPYGALDRDVARLVRSEMRWGASCEERAVAASLDAARVPRLDVKAWSAGELGARVRALLEPGGAAAQPATGTR